MVGRGELVRSAGSKSTTTAIPLGRGRSGTTPGNSERRLWSGFSAADGSVAGSRVGRRVVDSRVVRTAVERPILSGRFSTIHRVMWPYVGKILDTSESGFAVPSST